MEKINYSLIKGLWKSIKNTVIILGGSALLHLTQTRTQWLPIGYEWLDMLIGGVLAYMAKNAIEVKVQKKL